MRRRLPRGRVVCGVLAAALVMPAAVDYFAFGSLNARPDVLLRFSIWTSWVLLIVYVAGLLFAFKRR